MKKAGCVLSNLMAPEYSSIALGKSPDVKALLPWFFRSTACDMVGSRLALCSGVYVVSNKVRFVVVDRMLPRRGFRANLTIL